MRSLAIVLGFSVSVIRWNAIGVWFNVELFWFGVFGFWVRLRFEAESWKIESLEAEFNVESKSILFTRFCEKWESDLGLDAESKIESAESIAKFLRLYCPPPPR